MHGGMKVYAGAPAAARHYVEGGRGRADDSYLAQGTGNARSYTAGGGRVQELVALAGDTYELWVAGLEPGTGAPGGALRARARPSEARASPPGRRRPSRTWRRAGAGPMTMTWPRAPGMPAATPPAAVASRNSSHGPAIPASCGWPAWTRTPASRPVDCAPTTARC